METSSIREKIEEYFTSLNSTANRLMSDLQSIKRRESWNEMSYNEQSEAIWRNLVHNEIEEKYNRHSKHLPEVEYFPVLRIHPGEKIVVDDESANSRSGRPFGCSWRDEHSAPFSWETQSQLDLRLFGCPKKSDAPNPPDKLVTRSRLPTPDPSGPRTPTSVSTMRPKKAPPPPPVDYTLVKPTKQDGKDAKEITKDQSPQEDKNSDATKVQNKESKRTSIVDRNEESRNEDALSVDIQSPSQIPKTGFDFLDNW